MPFIFTQIIPAFSLPTLYFEEFIPIYSHIIHELGTKEFQSYRIRIKQRIFKENFSHCIMSSGEKEMEFSIIEIKEEASKPLISLLQWMFTIELHLQGFQEYFHKYFN
jgi:hypothetical protein